MAFPFDLYWFLEQLLLKTYADFNAIANLINFQFLLPY